MEGGKEKPEQLSAEGASFLEQGIGLLFSRWSALQMAVSDNWGGGDSIMKSQNLAAEVLSWFTHSKEAVLYIDDLEDILDESMISLFNTEIEDNSIEEIAEKLMVMHEECLQGNYNSIQILKDDVPITVNLPHIRQEAAGDDEDEDESEAMVVENPGPRARVDEPKAPEVDEEGWTIVGSRRGGNGRRN
ncbi:pre-rRNA-processing protein TSR2-like [Impatiens glandulifera]|uniref:pre-rRNA-processing protein TSR2-like n=1 Tax=Impatiens glandulifera TaxID=253017 RepID=UPI001FB158B5|nr:pre-rRNA-processing protein TSR2-like [Impatiens glandulifera]XP_047310960.1 pre-rRNA-processing protein TSR2-like [Impatiens glandulifera]XP_047310968.1 pre-rRNA-processing protein TSR2-like [Impatiens glandulifera]